MEYGHSMPSGRESGKPLSKRSKGLTSLPVTTATVPASTAASPALPFAPGPGGPTSAQLHFLQHKGNMANVPVPLSTANSFVSRDEVIATVSSMVTSTAAVTAATLNQAVATLRQEIFSHPALQPKAAKAASEGRSTAAAAASNTKHKDAVDGAPSKAASISDVVVLNVGGELFTTARCTLNRVPGSFLAHVGNNAVETLRDAAGRPFIDRNPRWFSAILDALREPAAVADLPLESPVVQRELEFYGLSHVFALGPQPKVFSTPGEPQQADAGDGTTSPVALMAVGGLNEASPYRYLRTAERYNPATENWVVMHDMFWDRAQSGVVSTGHHMFVLGGRGESPDRVVGHFDRASKQWQEAIAMTLPEPVYAAAYAMVRSRIMQIGGMLAGAGTGYSGSSTEMPTARTFTYMIDETPSLGSSNIMSALPRVWRAAASLQTPRGRHGVAVLGGFVYAVGGAGLDGSVLSTMERFDPSTNSWSSAPPMPEPRRDFGCTVADGRMYVVGGTSARLARPGKEPPASCTDTVFMYDPSTCTWSQLPTMLTARQGLTCSVVESKLYAIGGAVQDDVVPCKERLRTVERLDLSSMKWEVAAPLNIGRSHLGSGVLRDYDGGAVGGGARRL